MSCADTALRILSAAGAYLIIAVATRLSILVWPGISFRGIIHRSSYAIYDFLLVVGVAAVFLALSYLCRRRPIALHRLALSFAAIGYFLVILGCINVQAILLIGGPLTYQWLSYADFSSFTSQSSLAAALNLQFVLTTALASVGYFLLYFGFVRLFAAARANGRLPHVFGVATVLLLGFVVVAITRAHPPDEKGYVANPLLEIVATAIVGDVSNLLKHRDAIVPAHLPPRSHSRELLPAPFADGTAKNVVLIVLESVGANRVPGTGPAAAAAWMPNVARYRDTALAFPNIYTHAAYSTKALFSLVTGRAPEFGSEPETYTYRHAPFVTLGDRLKQRGYRTAFFMSGDFSFQSADKFLANRGFDHLADRDTIQCDGPEYKSSSIAWPNLDSIDDSCTARSVASWVTKPSNRPFFAMFWTGNTHWPYFSRPEPAPGQFSADPLYNRYLAALRSTDAAIGGLLDDLSRREMLAETLVIIVGDHGEAFREHGYLSHGSTLFEEEVRIPMLLIGRGLNGGSSTVLGAISDVPQTILHLVGEVPEPSWDGRSLFDPNRPGQVMFFVSLSDMAVGFRETNRKYVYQLTRSRPYVFDLARDPGESRNIADDKSAEYIRRHVAGWMQQNRRQLRPDGR